MRLILILLLFLTACGSDESVPPELINMDSIRQTMPASKVLKTKTHYARKNGKLFVEEHEFEISTGSLSVDGFKLHISHYRDGVYHCYFTGPLGAIHPYDIKVEDNVVSFAGEYYYTELPGSVAPKQQSVSVDTIEYVVRPTDNVSKVSNYLKVSQKNVTEANGGSQILHRGKKLIIKK